MKMGKAFSVPLSSAVISILRAQEAERGKNPFVFTGRPQRPLSAMSMSMLPKRLRVDTVHGRRSAARPWMADQGAPFELAEQCLAHTVGNAVVQGYQRSSMLERRRPLIQSWSEFLTGETGAKVIPLRARVGQWRR
jgi:integrase